MGCHLLQGIFLTQGSNPGLLHCRQTLYHLSHQGSLYIWASLVAQTIRESACQCRRPGFNPWFGKIPWRRKCCIYVIPNLPVHLTSLFPLGVHTFVLNSSLSWTTQSRARSSFHTGTHPLQCSISPALMNPSWSPCSTFTVCCGRLLLCV